ncbi:TIR domain-containing protein [Nostoc sp.]|uniref:TIR domain-containing protein n=1 Tax=Nostoc sp. TaxID=1180 RepID=UPI002FFC4961
MSNKFVFDVFLSYSTRDKNVVHGLAERLKNDGVRVWLDAWVIEPGHSIPLKIQEGVEQSRTLLMCMSPNYFKSEWGKLEHLSLLFRDPTNTQRRFIPILIADCERPNIIAQFLYIDWRNTSDEAYDKLLATCRGREVEPSESGLSMDSIIQEPIVLEEYDSEIYFIAITPDGKTVVSGSEDKTLKVWDLATGQCQATFEGHTNSVLVVAITPDGKTVVSGSFDKTLKVWDLATGQCRATFAGHTNDVYGVAITPDGKTVVSGSLDKTLKVWDLATGKCRATFEGDTDRVFVVAITPDSKIVVSGSEDHTLKVWDLATGQCRATFVGHTASVWAVAITPDGKTVVSGSEDATLKVWDLATGQCLATFEGHTDSVQVVAITRDGKTVVSGSDDETLKVWDLATGQCRATFAGHTDPVYGVAITPDGKTVISSSAGTLRIWQLPEPDSWSEATLGTRYTNAKVILAGDTGVGKSGLALRLTLDTFKPTISTDAHWASQFKLSQDTNTSNTAREIWLWDFAGQPDYRLIHQLFMDETQLAVLVFNPQQDNPFEGLGQWDSDLEKASRRPFKKLLVAGRCDRGGLMVSKNGIEEFQKERGFAAYLETSAQTGAGCDDLLQAIIENIDWDSIPWTATTQTFKTLKEEIIKLRDEDKVLLRMAELKQQFELRLPNQSFTIQELRAVVGLLAGPGLVWKLEFGDFVLLQPERINAYASALVRKVREHPEEIGCILERDILDANLDFQDMKRLPPDDEAIVLRAMHQTLVNYGICLREETEQGTQLVLPSFFKRERPDLEDHPAPIVSYQFKGGIEEIYATLVVRLHHTSTFDNDRLWKFAADFKTPADQQIGFKLTKKREGSAELMVYCNPEISIDTKVTFIRYVHEHLFQKGTDVHRDRHYVCPHCGTPVENLKTVQKRLEEGKKDILCVDCEDRVPLWDLIEQKFASPEFQERVRKLEAQSQAGIDNESKELILVGHAYAIAGEAGQIFRQISNSDRGIDGEIEFKNDQGEASGKRVYLHLKSGDSYLYKRKRDGKEIFNIKGHAKYWYPDSQNYPVMLVIRTSDQQIRWMNVSDYLAKHGKRKRQIEFDGEPFTAWNLVKLRNSLLA